MSTLRRYALLHIASWLGAGLAVALCWELDLISGQTAMALFVLWFLKDVVAYPFVRHAYEDNGRTRIEELLGSRGEVQRELAPLGFIRVRGELWRAEVADGAPPLAAGVPVIVRAARGMTLVVEPIAEDDSQSIVPR